MGLLIVVSLLFASLVDVSAAPAGKSFDRDLQRTGAQL